METSIKPVSPEELTSKITQAMYLVYSYVQVVIIPLTLAVCGISALLFIAGGILHSSQCRKLGVYGFFSAIGGLFLFWGIPVILGIVQQISNIIK